MQRVTFCVCVSNRGVKICSSADYSSGYNCNLHLHNRTVYFLKLYQCSLVAKGVAT